MDHHDYKFGKEELERLIAEEKKKKQQEEERAQQAAKPKRSAREIALWGVLGLIVTAYYAVIGFGNRFLPEDGIFYQSVNVFSGAEQPNPVLRIISLTILIFSLSWLVRRLLNMLSENKTLTKRTGVAVIKLAGSIVKFIAPVILLVLILNIVGVQTTQIIAGLGILSLVLGLGVTSMVEDIVAGMFIIAERTFDVGDIITVDGFYGTVMVIGIRSTQIADLGGNVLILRNSRIGSLVNMTTNLSSAFCTIEIAPDVPISVIDTVIGGAGDRIKAAVPDIKNGPFYLGIMAMDAYSTQIGIVGVCDEGRKYDVGRAITHEVRVIMEENNIKLGSQKAGILG